MSYDEVVAMWPNLYCGQLCTGLKKEPGTARQGTGELSGNRAKFFASTDEYFSAAVCTINYFYVSSQYSKEIFNLRGC